MKTIELNNTKITLYSSIKELPLFRYKAMQNYMLQDSGIGNTMQDIDKHLNNSIVFLGNNKVEDCREQLTNLRYAFYSMINGIDYKTKSFACLVKEMNGNECNDISTDGLSATVEELIAFNLSNADIEEVWTDVKKKLMLN